MSLQTKDKIELYKLSKKILCQSIKTVHQVLHQGWRKMKERNSRREIHFGHCIAAIENDKLMNINCKFALQVPIMGETINRETISGQPQKESKNFGKY